MKKIYHSQLLRVGGLLLGVLTWLANSSNPPTGVSGAPFDNGTCNNCHSGGAYSGTVSISGLPSTIEPNTTYPMEITLTATSGSPSRGGYQLVVVDGNNNNAGDLMTVNSQSGTEFFNGREYIEHRGSKVFSGGSVSWVFNWKSPVSAAGNTIKFYFIGNFCNGNGTTSGDVAFAFSETYNFAGAPPLSVSITDVNNVSCFGGNNGSATAEASGGVPPYTYLWSNGQNGQTAINLAAGTYTVTVTGSSGSGTATASVAITQPPILNVTATSSNPITCAMPTSTLTAAASGGTSPYSFEWPVGSGNSVEVSTPGTYVVTVTDGNGCTKTAQVTVTQNIVPPVANAGPAAVLTCAQPQVNLSGSGSTGPSFSYQWTASNGGNIVSGANTLNPLINAAGTYTLVVTNNANGCTSSSSTVATSNQQQPTASASGGSITCVNDSATVQVSTNANQATFSWVGPGGFSSNQASFQTATAGTYSVTVTNTANGCTNTASTQVTVDTLPPQVVVITDTLTCTDTAVVLLTTTNANPATFTWTGPEGFSSTQASPVVSMAGTYTVTVTNTANGCTNTASATVAQDTLTPSVSVIAEALTCADTIASLTLTTNADTASFAWTGPNGFTSAQQSPQVSVPGTYSVVVTNVLNGCSSSTSASVVLDTVAPSIEIAPPLNLNCQNDSIQLDASASSQGQQFAYLWTTSDGNILSGDSTLTPWVNEAGTYVLLITNTANGCSASDSTAVIQSVPVEANVTSTTPVACFGEQNGSATAAGSGGTGSFSYLWSNGDTTATVQNLSAGTYFVTITDGEGCSATTSAEITQPGLLQANASATPETAFQANDGTATATPTGGTSPYTYAWNNGDTTATIIGLAPGPYTVTVEDANGCTHVQTVTVNSFDCTLTATITTTPLTCFGANDGTASVAANNGIPPYTYLWSNGDTTATASNLAPGSYTATVTDNAGCSQVLSEQVIGPPALQANASATPETGFNRNDGTATAAPVGGTPPYAYSWSNGGNTPTITGLVPGTYTVTVEDANGCSTSQTVVVSAFNCNLAASVTATNVLCAGQANGSATATPVNGTAPYTYAWSNGWNTPTIADLMAGIYTVTISDAAGCQAIGTATVSQPAPLEAEIETTPTSCPESQDGGLKVIISGGTPPYMFSWPGGNPNALGVGTYTVTIIDANGCTLLKSATITSNDTTPPVLTCPPSVSGCADVPLTFATPLAADNCALGNAQPVLVQGLPSGSTFPVGQTLQVFEITDASGNTASCSFVITVGPPIEVRLDTVVNDIGGAGKGRIEVSVSGGTGSLSFAWTKDGQPFATTQNLDSLRAGIYELTITDENGCSRTLGPVMVEDIISTAEPGADVRVSIWPNPTAEHLYIQVTGTTPAAVFLLNARGQLMQTLRPAELGQALHVAHWASGLYYAHVQDAYGRSWLLPWVKQ